MQNTRLKALTEMMTNVADQIKLTLNVTLLVGISHKLRAMGIPADTITIDCLKSNKRILIVLHDQQPYTVNYQYMFVGTDPNNEFVQIDNENFSEESLFSIIANYLYKDL